METKSSNLKSGQYLTFKLQARPFGFAIETVREINRMGDITPVPGTPSYMAGVMNLRGKVIPVVDLRLKFGVEVTPYTRETCIIVVEGSAGLIGTIVDSVSDVLEIKEDQIEPPPLMTQDEASNWVMGVGKVDDRVILLVDILNAISRESLVKHFYSTSESGPTPNEK